MGLSVGEAAKAVGMTRQAIQAALKKGTISGTRKSPNGPWEIDPAELFRVYQPAKRETDDLATIGSQKEAEIRELAAKLKAADELLAHLQAQNEDLMKQRDAWQIEAQDWKQKALPAAPEQKRGFWGRLFNR